MLCSSAVLWSQGEAKTDQECSNTKVIKAAHPSAPSCCALFAGSENIAYKREGGSTGLNLDGDRLPAIGLSVRILRIERPR
jgi:hypothetical protein